MLNAPRCGGKIMQRCAVESANKVEIKKAMDFIIIISQLIIMCVLRSGFI